MTLDPIDAQKFSSACRTSEHRSAAPCHWPQVLRLMAFAGIACLLVTAALGPRPAKAAIPHPSVVMTR